MAPIVMMAVSATCADLRGSARNNRRVVAEESQKTSPDETSWAEPRASYGDGFTHGIVSLGPSGPLGFVENGG
jgi:hypothetical protein